ncbi:hypothetical protein GCM10025870_07010 [Agromyces marinus]|uniref:Uncharacterized protein n=1 Tax=Agromyces marinus TaxID=1389020 RepID=A0ABM8GYQ3_9MICO|nr:hypothetical protein GCM10025870_07010 [Agromyces marinus]
MFALDLELRPRERAEPRAPVGRVEALVGFGRQAGAAFLHEDEEVVLRGDVAVERHGRVAERLRHSAHRDGREAFGVGDLDGGVDDALDAHLALGAALRVRGDAPREGDAPGQVGLDGRVAAHPAPIGVRDCIESRTVYYLNGSGCHTQFT